MVRGDRLETEGIPDEGIDDTFAIFLIMRILRHWQVAHADGIEVKQDNPDLAIHNNYGSGANVTMSLASAAFQTRTEPSSPPETTKVPSGVVASR